jgi:hypothetical protein
MWCQSRSASNCGIQAVETQVLAIWMCDIESQPFSTEMIA